MMLELSEKERTNGSGQRCHAIDQIIAVVWGRCGCLEVLEGLVGYKVIPERGVAQNARQAGGMTWLAESKVANTI